MRTVGRGWARIGDWIDQARRRDGHGVIACSALKRRYRDVLVGERCDVRLIYLKGEEAQILPVDVALHRLGL
jgi:gluconokinase